MQRKPHSLFQKTLIASVIGSAMTPQMASALDLAQAPPGSYEPYVAPNVIISVDDSGSMDFCLNKESASGCIGNTGASDRITAPNADGTWPVNARRINVLKYALQQVFNDKDLLPDGKIRLAWQTMHNNAKSPGAGTVDNSSRYENAMSVLSANHRANFLKFVKDLKALNGTPSPKMMAQVDSYMRKPLSKDGPWAAIPGQQAEPYLGCRRNYHIMMTDGRWNEAKTGAGNADNTKTTLPDGTAYSVVDGQTRIYRDGASNTLADWSFKSWSQNLQPSLYDKNNKEKQVPVTAEYRKAPPTEDINGFALEKYWNPKYNPANWPHVVTYTIGFSQMATTWSTSTITRPTELVPFGWNGSFPNLIKGTATWPNLSASTETNNSLDLWHAAINGRGRFFAVENGEDLEKAFRLIVQQINTENEPDRGSTATSGSTATRNDVGKYVANYDPQAKWKGWIEGEIVKTNGETIPAPEWGGKTTADKLDQRSPDDRVILTWNDAKHVGAPFRWATDGSTLSAEQRAHLNKKANGTADTLGADRLKYIRGDTTKQGEDEAYTTTKPFRERKSVQGDIINSLVWYTGYPNSNYALKGYSAFTRLHRNRTPMIYVGGNDGMLHGFSAVDGTEKIAYVPRGAIPGLTQLTDPDYKHRYFVDGSPMTGDVDLGVGDPNDNGFVPNWKTLLVGSMGGGGKGYFILDVTTPGSTNAGGEASNFSEGNASSLVIMDKTMHASESLPNCSTLTDMAAKNECLDKEDIGHIFAHPVLDENNPMRTTQITRLNNNRWAVVMGNGYNSKNGRPVLLIQYLDGDKELQRIVATGNKAVGADADTTDNGLSAPRLVDLNSDGRPDVAYAGDLAGNLWKFDLNGSDHFKWHTAFEGKPLYKAIGPASPNSTRNQLQPITAAPAVKAIDRYKVVTEPDGTQTSQQVGGMMVAFGTGRNVTKDDPLSVNVQSLYAVRDNTQYKRTSDGYLTVCRTGDTEFDCKTPSPVDSISKLVKRSVSNTGIEGSGSSEERTFWTIEEDQPLNWNVHEGWYMDLPSTGERLLKSMGFFDGSNLLTIYSQVPAKGSDPDEGPSNVESCKTTSVDDERQYLTLMNIMDGKRPSVQLMDTNGDGLYNADDGGTSRITVTKGSQTMITKGDRIVNHGAKDRQDEFARLPEQSMRPSWRQLR